ncbi:pyridoxal phosphate-dependent decarboxylase family protein [Membranihabitans marinus]|uniref:pyridoxal phosphate-dependent decarboxylase family protein n=1 Tax=Membranihabitans marinus TaxID=1227546 RepID=UPI001F3488EC|nr:aminotransferase class V-fold PLP-dependent enzyme [Membranihabitans marinus]
MDNKRRATLEIEKEEFKKIGHQLIDKIADYIDHIDNHLITTNKSNLEIKSLLGQGRLPDTGLPVIDIVEKATELLFDNSLLNGHPKFMGYITSSAAPIGMLAELLVGAVNPNVGAQLISPMATEIEKQTIQWLAEFIGLSKDYGGILVSGGNMANFTAFLAARTAKGPSIIKSDGLLAFPKQMMIYCSKNTHTWVDKAAILFGHGANSIRWIPTDNSNKIDLDLLEQAINTDIRAGHQPFIIVASGGDVSTGTVDDLKALGKMSKKYDLWFHIDGAYGIPAAVIPELKPIFDGIEEADSLALDPHKWLYSPLEAGCTLVKNSKHLTDTYSSHPEYYNFKKEGDELTQNYYEYGLQNSRGFRALKIWMALQQVGRKGYEKLIGDDIALSKLLYQMADQHSSLEAISQNLSITNFRFIPVDGHQYEDDYLNTINETLLNELQAGGEVFLSHALVFGKYCLRSCIVNFRTTEKDISEIIDIIVREGSKIHEALSVK